MGKYPDRARIVIDLQAAQTEGSRHRGVGRYSLAFAQALARARGKHDIRIVANEAYGDSISTIDVAMEGLLPTKTHISHYTYPPVNKRLWTPGDLERTVGSHLINHRYARLQPDVLHLSHVFEGYSGNAVVPAQLPQIPGVITSATLYDLIPLRFRGIYLADPEVERWYQEKLDLLKQCDLLLAISESTRQDAIELLGIAPEKIVAIFGACEDYFKKIDYLADTRAQFLTRYGIRERYVLYTGGDDHRKNLIGALAGYASLPSEVRRKCQFVIVCALLPERKNFYMQQARHLGLTDDEVVFTGFVPDTDLVAFYNSCSVFVFPSLYEGFGLPVLEAMACGAPVIAADNSSIREITQMPDALFDASDPQSIARLLSKVLVNDAFAVTLRDWGVVRARDFTWAKTAALALRAFEQAFDKAKGFDAIAVASRLPRKRLAYFSPLPPCRSGIADYNAMFLPFLSKHFRIDLFVDDYEVSDPWLRANFRIFSHRDYPRLSDGYASAIYEFGNSEFHVHMLDLLSQYPGIVGLHDAYLSGLIGYVDFNCGRSGYFNNEMLYSHGARAQRLLAPASRNSDPVGEAVRQLPCTRRVLDQAIGIIAHSRFNLDVSNEFYPEGWRAPFRIIKQLVKLPALAPVEERSAIRQSLGFQEGDFLIATFGHIAWTKAGDLLLDAFENFLSPKHANAMLIFVGELAKDQFGESLKARVERDVSMKVRITGYLEENEYNRYLRAADVGVQLRKFSRGGTPKGVLDCLSYGVPLIINDYASYSDYPKDIAIKLPAEPSAQELADALSLCLRDGELRAQLASAGREYVTREHNPEQIAAQYACTIQEYIDRNNALSRSKLIQQIADELRGTDSARDEQYLREVANSIARPDASFGARRILIDVSHICHFDHQAGIQRVVRNIVKGLYRTERSKIAPIAVKVHNDSLVEPKAWIESLGLLASEKAFWASSARIQPVPGDIFLLLDYAFATIDDLRAWIDKFRRSRGNVYAVIYDILPIQFPQLVIPGAADWFRNRFEQLAQLCDGLVCISKTTAHDVADYLGNSGCQRVCSVKIGWFHLGADSDLVSLVSNSDSRIKAAISTHPFLMVGTIEPRKGHAFALDAFELLWAEGNDAPLCIMGKPGWMHEDILRRISNHPQRGRLLHYIEHPTDGELAHAYRNSRALLFPSIAEGFGLPIIEAGRNGLPVIASDIAVFREIGGDSISYFDRTTPAKLAEVIKAWMMKRPSDLPDISKMKILSWEESAGRLLSVILDDNWNTILSPSDQ